MIPSSSKVPSSFLDDSVFMMLNGRYIDVGKLMKGIRITTVQSIDSHDRRTSS